MELSTEKISRIFIRAVPAPEDMARESSHSEVLCQGALGYMLSAVFVYIFMHRPFTWRTAWFCCSYFVMIFRDESTEPWMAWIRRTSTSVEGETWTNSWQPPTPRRPCSATSSSSQVWPLSTHNSLLVLVWLAGARIAISSAGVVTSLGLLVKVFPNS